jgi:protease IV
VTWRPPVKRVVIAILAALGGLMILGILFVIAMSWALLSPTPLPSQIVIEYDLDRGLTEAAPTDPFAMALDRGRITTRDLVEGMVAAADDDRVVGLLVRGGSGPGGWARVEEVRDAVLHFRESGKPAVFFSESFGELAAGQGIYYLASAFDEVVLQPSGDVGLMPLVAEMPFLGGMLEKLDVVPRFDTRWEYKDATDMLTERGFSEESREAVEALLSSILSELVEGVAEGRGLSADSVRSLVGTGPYMASEAVAAGLVDRLAYLDEARDLALELTGQVGARRIALREYLDRGGRAWNRGTQVALVHGVGSIERGRGGWDPLTGGGSLGAARVAGYLRDAVDDDRVAAILFRVESPGGSYVASDVVRREILRARGAGKPVVVSMGNVAASGGYLISADADRIVAHPSTLTGSIGVAGGKLVTEDLWSRFGIEWDRVEVGGPNTMFSGVEDFSEAEWARFQDFLDRTYDEFVQIVADGRGMDVGAVDAVARGRVWTGSDALDRGLVDVLGGYRVALGEVRSLLELDPDARLHLRAFPGEPSLLQLLLEEDWRVGIRTAGVEGVAMDRLLALLGPVIRRAAAVGLLGERGGELRMPPWQIPAP